MSEGWNRVYETWALLKKQAKRERNTEHIHGIVCSLNWSAALDSLEEASRAVEECFQFRTCWAYKRESGSESWVAIHDMMVDWLTDKLLANAISMTRGCRGVSGTIKLEGCLCDLHSYFPAFYILRVCWDYLHHVFNAVLEKNARPSSGRSRRQPGAVRTLTFRFCITPI